MQDSEVKTLLETHFPDSHIEVRAMGSHYELLIVSAAFSGLMPVKKQQLVYAAINDKIIDGSMHAIDSMKLFTHEQWAKKNA